jgi:hypothetical protein
MISLLHEKDYEMLGGIEIREDDWQRIRRMGLVRFMITCSAASYGGRIATFLLLSAFTQIHGFWKLDPAAWFLITIGILYAGASLLHALRAWYRMEQRFNRSEARK